MSAVARQIPFALPMPEPVTPEDVVALVKAETARAARVVSEHRPHKDPAVQAKIWQARLVRMARQGKGSRAQRLAGELLDAHGLDARRVLVDERPDISGDLRRRCNDLLAGCGLAVYGVTTHQAEQIEAFR